jgi:hypothetical protein
MLDERNGYLFAVFDNALNFTSAAESCRKLGATLPVIKNKPTQGHVL